MVRKVRLCRAVEANVGERRAYKKQLVRIQRDFQNYVLGEIFTELERQNALAYDEKLPKNDELKALKGKTLKRLRRDENFDKFLQAIVSKNLKRWLDALKQVSTKEAERFVKKAVRSSTNAQRAALIAAGVKPSLLRSAWTVPTVGKQYISPAVAGSMNEMVSNNVKLITRIGENDISRITEVLTTGLQEGLDYDRLRKELNETNGFDGARADRVALDQVNKINQQVQILNAQSIGCTHARWKHVPGQYTSRRTHIEMDGKEFNLNEGLYDKDVDKYVMPGELPYCFPAGSKLTFVQGVNKLYRHFYSGELTFVVTDRYGTLRTTPNHPIFTNIGWISANSLKVGDCVFCAKEKTFGVLGCDSNYRITTLDKLFNSFTFAGGMPFKLSGSDSQFHGDGSFKSKVDVIDVNSFLSDGFKPGGAEKIVEFIFSWTKKTRFGFFYDCFFDENFVSVLRSASSLMCMCNERLALLRSHLSEPYIVSLGASAAFYTAFGELSIDNATVYSVLLGNCELGHSRDVISNSSVSVKTGGVHILEQAELTEPPSKVGGGKIDRPGSLLTGGAFLKKTVRIKDIVHVPFSGHVYNLESLTGWFGCEHYTVHNCRCVSRLILPSET